MKAEDLMVGDWIFYKNFNGNLIPHKIIGISETYAEFKDPPYNMYQYEKIQPIPLTPETLEKNGIKLFSTCTHPYRDGEWEEGELEEAMKHYPMYVYQTLNPYIVFVIRPNEQELKVCSSNYKTIVEKKEKVVFVHELQHALKHCKIEKNIIL